MLVCALLALAQLALGTGQIIDDFESGLKAHWEVKEFKGKTVYTVVPEGGGHVLRAESRGTASGLIYKIDYDPNEYPLLRWRWKVENVLRKGDETRKGGDDYAARVYVVFPHWLPFKTRSLNYIWANRLPKGEHTPNPFYSNAVMVAAESGQEMIGHWVSERRDIRQDYRRIFGAEPPKVGAIALMTDTDNTGESAVAYYDDIRIE